MTIHRFKTFFLVLFLLITVAASAQIQKTAPFNKVIVSPYVQVTFVQGDEESVTIDKIYVDADKLHIDVNDKTLRIYLEGAKELPGNEKDWSNGYKGTHHLYDDGSVVVTVIYKKLESVSLRGKEDQLFKSPINGDKFMLKIYGESNVIVNEMNLKKLYATLYGESSLEIKAGSVKDQKYTSYGESKINSLAIDGSVGRVTAYGRAEFNLNVTDRIRVTSFGEAELHYKGSPTIDKGLHFGDMVINKLD